MDRDELLNRLARVLDQDSLDRAARDLEAFENAGGDTHWLAQVVEAADRLPLPEVPAILTQDLKNLIADDHLTSVVEARLVSDTRIHRALAGVRGADATDGWSMSFTSETADLVVDVWPKGSGQLAVEGHVMAHGAATSAYRASAVGPHTVQAEGDRLGRFDLGVLPPGRYDLVVSNGLMELSAVLDLEDPQP